MTSMTVTPPPLQPMYGGVDTHKDTHHAAVVDTDGHRIADREFATGQHGDDQMCAWLTQWPIEAIAVEQTGTYGAGLTRSLHAEGYWRTLLDDCLPINHLYRKTMLAAIYVYQLQDWHVARLTVRLIVQYQP